MTTSIKSMSTTLASGRTGLGVRELGFWSAILTSIFAIIAFAIGINTPPRSGPFCAAACVTYPYTDAAAFVPRDYLWMYPASLMALIFSILTVCIHQRAAENRKLFSQIALSLALISMAVLVLDYFIQLAIMQSSLLKGETEGLSLFTQYNPHGIFIGLENLGYLMMSLSFLFAAPVFAGSTRLERSLRWIFAISAVLALAVFVIFAVLFGANLDYRFEIAVITIDWTVLIVSGLLLSFWFRRAET